MADHISTLILEARDNGFAQVTGRVEQDTRKIERAFNGVDTSQFERQMRNAGDAAREVGDDFEGIGDGIGESTGSFDGLIGQFGGIEGMLGKVNPALGDMAGKLASAGPLVGGIGAFVAVGGLAVSMLDQMGEEAIQLNSHLADVQIRTGDYGTSLAELREQAFEIADSGLVGTVEDVAPALAAAKQITDETGESLNDTTEKALFFAQKFEEDVRLGLESAQRGADGFEVGIGDVQDAILRLSQTTGADDVLDTFKEYPSVIGDAGFELGQFVGIIEAGMQAGARNTDVVADALKEFAIRVRDGSDASVAALDGIGVGADELFERFAQGEDVGDVFSEIVDAVESIEDPIQRQQAGVALFGTKFEDLGEAIFFSLNESTVAMEDFAGATDEAMIAALDGISEVRNQNDLLKQEIRASIGESVLPLKEAWAEMMNQRLTGLRDSLDETSTATERLTGLSETLRYTGFLGWLVDDAAQVAGWLDGTADSAENVVNALTSYPELLSEAEQSARGAAQASAMASSAIDEIGQSVSQIDLSSVDGKLITTSEHMIGVRDAQREVDAALEASKAEEAARKADLLAEAEERVRKATVDARGAIESLNSTVTDGFLTTIDQIDAGEIPTIGAALLQVGSDADVSATEMALFQLASGNASEQAVADALKYEVLKVGLGELREAWQSGAITAGEFVTMGKELGETLDQQFTLGFAEEGIDGVIERTDELMQRAEGAVAQSYGVTFEDNLPDIIPSVEALKGKLDEIDQVQAEAFIAAQTAEATGGVSGFRQQIADDVEQEYTSVIMADTAPGDESLASFVGDVGAFVGADHTPIITANTGPAMADVSELERYVLGVVDEPYWIEFTTNAGDVLDNQVKPLASWLDRIGGSTYTFKVVADTSAVPAWAIPQSPPEIHRRFMDMRDDMARNPIPIRFDADEAPEVNTGPILREAVRGQGGNAVDVGQFGAAQNVTLVNIGERSIVVEGTEQLGLLGALIEELRD